MQFQCTDGSYIGAWGGGGLNWGGWKGWRHCSGNQAVCGIRTQVEPPHDGDDTALNGIILSCCDIVGH